MPTDPVTAHKQLVSELVTGIKTVHEPKLSTETGLMLTSFDTTTPSAEMLKRLCQMNFTTADGKFYSSADLPGHFVMYRGGRDSRISSLQVRTKTASPR